MSGHSIAAKSKEEQGKVNVDLAASGVAYKERLNMQIISEQVARDLREIYMGSMRHYGLRSIMAY
ncbi:MULTISPECIES: DNA polymerase III subunit theta [Citrobacter]|jgi:DNA polymerase-3 subunit theta|uniref:DNA polymerase III subunit theta n=1 Tax=Citrobacter TaxID=544 RepID=UPI000B8E3849|nr:MULTISPECIES: DNA polymerase III subunit theta [Citrobacter]MBA8129404.1 DNA polymerase III subunit theta [Citrobacter sp. RHBSTW-00013]MBJ8821753.1 DNA polymerase III subunit theta [Citrobacter braakii]QLZ41900.1 DNA polymerase III subunit theta [Citrobacter sp. RHBSTW-00127]